MTLKTHYILATISFCLCCVLVLIAAGLFVITFYQSLNSGIDYRFTSRAWCVCYIIQTAVAIIAGIRLSHSTPKQ